MMSAMPDQSAKMKSVHLGADDYLVKPFSMAELQSSVERLLQRSPAAAQAPAAPAPDTDVQEAKTTGTPLVRCICPERHFGEKIA